LGKSRAEPGGARRCANPPKDRGWGCPGGPELPPGTGAGPGAARGTGARCSPPGVAARCQGKPGERSRAGAARPALTRPRPAFGIFRRRPENEGVEISSGQAVLGKGGPLRGKAGGLLLKQQKNPKTKQTKI